MSEGKNLIGVDIGSSSVKVAQLRDSRKGLGLVRLAYEPLPAQSIVDGHIMNSQAVTEALGKAFATAKIKQKEIALSISGQAVIIRKLTVPTMTPAELDEQINWEAEQHIPFDIKDVHVDYEILKRRPESGQMDIVLVAAKKDEINDYTQLARGAKLKPMVIDIDAFTIQNVFELNRGGLPEQSFALLNIGASLASLNIVSRGVSQFTREIANGGNYITEQIQKQLAVTFEQAEAFKCGQGGDAPAQLATVVESVCDSIAAEIQRSLDFFLATSGDTEMSRIYLTGGSSNLLPLQAALAKRSRIAVEVIKPFDRIGIDDKDVNRELMETRASQFCVALGLAMRKDREKRS